MMLLAPQDRGVTSASNALAIFFGLAVVVAVLAAAAFGYKKYRDNRCVAWTAVETNLSKLLAFQYSSNLSAGTETKSFC